jgi:hypothetical protein
MAWVVKPSSVLMTLVCESTTQLERGPRLWGLVIWVLETAPEIEWTCSLLTPLLSGEEVARDEEVWRAYSRETCTTCSMFVTPNGL